jgi:hypothetical protein
MPFTAIHTYHDVVDHLLDHFGGLEGGRNLKMAKRAALAAYRTLPSVYNWSYFYKRGRITSVAAYSTGTIAYDHTGGTYERQVTLTSGTWPSWAARGILRISNIDYDVHERKSDTVVTLSASSNPGADVASSTTYTLSRDAYPLPVDFQSADQLRNVNKNWTWPSYVAPGDWLTAHSTREASNDPRLYTIMADPDFYGTMSVYFYPPPSAAHSFDFIYQREPGPLVVESYTTGTISVPVSSATLTGTGTAFTSSMKGSVLQFGTTTELPTGIDGLRPYQEQRTIASVNSSTELTLDAVVSNPHTTVKYRISDIVDIESGAMFEAFMSLAELKLSELMKDEQIPLRDQIYSNNLRLAMQADNRSYGDERDRPYENIVHLRDYSTVTP